MEVPAVPAGPRIVVAGAPGKLRERVRRTLEAGAYRVTCVDDVEGARRAVALAVYELVVLVAPQEASSPSDITSLCEATTTPVLVLTSSAGGAGVVRALDAGAADALAHPHPRTQLLARVRLALRKQRSVTARRAMRFGELSLDVDQRVVHLAGEAIELGRMEYRLLVELMLAGGRIAPRDTLLERIWGAPDPERLNDLRVHVNRLRKKLEREGVAGPVILSVPGLGYRLALRTP